MKALFKFCQSDHVELHNCNFSIFLKNVCICFFNWHIKRLFIIHEFCQILSFYRLKLFHVLVDQNFSYFSCCHLFWHEFLIVVVDAVQKMILSSCIQLFFFKIHIFVEKRFISADWVFKSFDECWSKCCFVVKIHNFSKFFVFESLLHHFESFLLILTC